MHISDTAPARAPTTGSDVDALGAAPEASGSTGSVAVESESPVLPSPQSQAPEAPQDEGRVAISSDPAQPPAPDPGEADAGLTGGETGDETDGEAVGDTGGETRSAVPDFPDEEETPTLAPEHRHPQTRGREPPGRMDCCLLRVPASCGFGRSIRVLLRFSWTSAPVAAGFCLSVTSGALGEEFDGRAGSSGTSSTCSGGLVSA